jgi:hypothetical protein
LVASRDIEAHLNAQGVRHAERTNDMLTIPTFSMGSNPKGKSKNKNKNDKKNISAPPSIKSAKVMLDLQKVK